MGVLGAFFGCRGDGGFMLACISGCRGVIGFNVATSQLPVREKVRPACSKWPKMSVLWRAGRTCSRNSRGTNCAGRTFSRKRCWNPRARRIVSQASSRGIPPPGGRHLRSNRKVTCWDHHERMGMKKALPKECLVEMQNPHRWIAPRGAAARPEGLEPPTF